MHTSARPLQPPSAFFNATYGILVAFTIVTAWAEHTHVHEFVASEAATLLIGLTQATVIWPDDPFAGGGPGVSYEPFESIVNAAGRPRA